MSRVMAGIAVLALLSSGGIGAQTAAPLPLRDRPSRTGTASISGRIVDGATGAPLRRAGVRIIGPAIGGSRGTLRMVRDATHFRTSSGIVQPDRTQDRLR